MVLSFSVLEPPPFGKDVNFPIDEDTLRVLGFKKDKKPPTSEQCRTCLKVVVFNVLCRSQVDFLVFAVKAPEVTHLTSLLARDLFWLQGFGFAICSFKIVFFFSFCLITMCFSVYVIFWTLLFVDCYYVCF